MEIRTRNIIVGSLLGDGWLDPLSPQTGTSTYHLKQDDKRLSYLTWVRNQILELNPSALKAKRGYTQHHFYTQARQDLGELRKQFYPGEGKKRVPESILKLLNDPLSLAIWYQEDGTLDRRSKYHWNIRIATYCFPYEDCVRLCDTLKINFDLDVSVCRCKMREKVYYQLYVPSRSMENFISLVRPHISPVFSYKILAKFS